VKSANYYKEAAAQAASQARDTVVTAAGEYRAKIEERARQKQQEAEAAGKDDKSVEGTGKAEEAAASPDEKAKSE